MTALVPYKSPRMVFVYGTLKQGFPNYRTMVQSNGRHVLDWTTPPAYTMYSLDHFPGVVPGGMTPIRGQIFEVDNMLFLDVLECVPSMFKREKIRTPVGDCWMYFLQPHNLKRRPNKKIYSGVWEAGK